MHTVPRRSLPGVLMGIPLVFFLLLAASCSRPGEPVQAPDRAKPQGSPEAGPSEPAKAGPNPAQVGIDEGGKMHPSSEDRCPVCAMKVVENPEFVSGIRCRDGKSFYFCAPGCMIRAWLHPEIFLAENRENLDKAVVQDYFDGEHVDAYSVLWIAGSDVVGPMGPSLVPVMDESEVAAFRGRHGGDPFFRLSEMNDERWKTITGKSVLPDRKGPKAGH
jgi:copper chaperone NosL